MEGQPRRLLVLQGFGPLAGAQMALVARLAEAGMDFDELHATSSGAWACVLLLALRCGELPGGDVPKVVANCLCQPWRLFRLLEASEAAALRLAEDPRAEARLDEEVRKARVFIYSYDLTGQRRVEEAWTWRELLSAARRSASIPFLTMRLGHDARVGGLDGVSVRCDDLRAPAGGVKLVVFTSELPSPWATLRGLCGVRGTLVSPLALSIVGAPDKALNTHDVVRWLLLLLLRFQAFVARRGVTSALHLCFLAGGVHIWRGLLWKKAREAVTAQRAVAGSGR